MLAKILNAVLTVWCQHPIKSRQIYSGLGHQCGQFGNEVPRLEYDMYCPISIRCLQLVSDHTPGGCSAE